MVLGELKYARSHFPSVGILDSSLIVTAGKMDISWEDRQLGQQTVEIFKVRFRRSEKGTKFEKIFPFQFDFTQ